MSLSEIQSFFDGLPAFARFSDVGNTALYRPLPEGWIIGVADIVDSTGAIRSGGYKAVNMAGASVIAAIGNAIGTHHFPFAFGGDGASFALPGGLASVAEEALGATRSWSATRLGLSLRAACLPVESVRAAGQDVTVARFAVGPELAYAMFAGGGLAWAEARMKAGLLPLATAAPGSMPDLAGLSCRFDPVVSRQGWIVSLIAVPLPGMPPELFPALMSDLTAIIGAAGTGEGNPVTAEGLRLRWPARGLALEEDATRNGRNPFIHRLSLGGYSLLAWALMASGLRLGRFDPARYRRETQRNSDFRKYSDRLELTLDCSQAVVDALRARLDEAEARGIALYGLHLQKEALITCLVRSPVEADHIHFVDGADGGYVQAARLLKSKLATREQAA